MKFSIKDLFSKCEQIRSLLKKSLMENLIFCALCRSSVCGTIIMKHSEDYFIFCNVLC